VRKCHDAVQGEPALGPKPITVHRLILACTIVAAKLCDDDVFKNSVWARVGGVAPSDLLQLELTVLRSMHQTVPCGLLIPTEQLARLLLRNSTSASAIKPGHGECRIFLPFTVGLFSTILFACGLAAHCAYDMQHFKSRLYDVLGSDIERH
jgi:hypothetical protein